MIHVVSGKAYKVLGHIDILGDPLSLGQSISSGVIGFVTEVNDFRDLARPITPHPPLLPSALANLSTLVNYPALSRGMPNYRVYWQTGSGNIAEGSKVLIKGVVGGTAGSISKMTGALDNAVRGAGGLDAGKSGNVSGGGLSSRKVNERLSLCCWVDAW